jgi:hypothetical protein
MIDGAHIIIYSKDAGADRNVLRDGRSLRVQLSVRPATP